MLELYKTPLQAIPLPKLSQKEHRIFDCLSKIIIFLRGQGRNTDIWEQVSDFLVVEHYFSTSKESPQIRYAVEHNFDYFLKNREADDMKNQKSIDMIQKIQEEWKMIDSSVAQKIRIFRRAHPKICH